MNQTPHPGIALLKYRGDQIEFRLHLSSPAKGEAWLRTNIGHAEVTRRETIGQVNFNRAKMNEDWFDYPMKRVSDTEFVIRLPLLEVGHFEAKAFFMPEYSTDPVWPAGSNTSVNVEPDQYCAGNSLYNAFVRQFGQTKEKNEEKPVDKEVVYAMDRQGYTVIPPSGTFRDLINELDFIINDMRCRIIQLLPINPVPTTFARMGRYGSPYASLDFTAVDPALAEFDKYATPLDQFMELVDAVHARDGRLFLDIAINHTGWAAKVHETHPHWLEREEDGAIHSPGAWGVTWEDLTELDHNCYDLWLYLADVFLTWCERGVDGFRCDAGYMIPHNAWQYIIATVRNQYPDTVFLLEGLGGDPNVTEQLLDTGNFNWAYSELFQNFHRQDIQHYMNGAYRVSESKGVLIHFAETHDNTRLAAKSPEYARMRTALSALLSVNGAFGFANGVEWLATEKIDVHKSRSLNWGASKNQVDDIRLYNCILSFHPAFHHGARVRMIHTGHDNTLAVLRYNETVGKHLLILVNLEEKTNARVLWNPDMLPKKVGKYFDLLKKRTVYVKDAEKDPGIILKPLSVLCLSPDEEDLEYVNREKREGHIIPAAAVRQMLKAKVLDVLYYYRNFGDLGDVDPESAVEEFIADPIEFCRRANPVSLESRVIHWQWPHDLKRMVMVPPRCFLYITAPCPFRASIKSEKDAVDQLDSIRLNKETFFALFQPLPDTEKHVEYKLKVCAYKHINQCERDTAPLLSLARTADKDVSVTVGHDDVMREEYMILGTNGRGGMMRAAVNWGTLPSKYDALLAGNLSTEFPEDRHIMLNRYRGWVVFQGYSSEINLSCLDRFIHHPESAGEWFFRLPVGLGKSIRLSVQGKMIHETNAVIFRFFRLPAEKGELENHREVKLIIRADVDDRSFHQVTKAFAGPEKNWPGAVKADHQGFVFTPSHTRKLMIHASDNGRFHREDAWCYCMKHHVETDRGMDDMSDAYSPGYFQFDLTGKAEVRLTAQILTDAEPDPVTVGQGSLAPELYQEPDLFTTLERSMKDYIVKRENLKTVIAGYPWFLDWGRDTLICVRGMIAADMFDDVKAILRQFASFEEDGTLPNIIHGEDVGNRDTSDAPLWFFVACRNLTDALGNTKFLKEKVGSRTILQVLVSIAENYSKGVPNGIRMDNKSGLIYSPSHFTWMDTNFPAGTPREGYPVEIQALWHAALAYLTLVDRNQAKYWEELAERVRKSIKKHFVLKGKNRLSDCLHATHEQSAAEATQDDAVRPNQLLAITLGAVEDQSLCRGILDSCWQLLIPGAIRSLADKPVKCPLPVLGDGHVINDPDHPYWGEYTGDEDSRRKPAYHNGTAWTWPFPLFSEAWFKTYGEGGKNFAEAVLGSSTYIMNRGCLAQIPEILDGNYPHKQRGCDAQAWGVTELYRVLKYIKKQKELIVTTPAIPEPPADEIPVILREDPYLMPFKDFYLRHINRVNQLEAQLTNGRCTLADFASGHEYFGLHFREGKWYFREWAPNATAIYLIGTFNGWMEDENFALEAIGNGVWEAVLEEKKIKHMDYFKLSLHWSEGQGERIPSYARRVVQDEESKVFSAQVWRPETPYEWHDEEFTANTQPPLIYEAHIGMAQEEPKVGTYKEFTDSVLQRIADAGYNTIQLMAIQEHPYYGSFGYHVSNFFAASSRFGTPEDLKALVDKAHALGLSVIMDIVHSHAVKNELEGLSRFDGTVYQYFHDGPRGEHHAWDSRCFDYGKTQVLHFLLSNCRYWIDEYHFDGFRFDGVTSMLYLDHGLGQAFSSYDNYFSPNLDEDAVAYLTLANNVIHAVKPSAITVAEDMSGFPGCAAPSWKGGVGFDFRLAMGIPDFWIKTVKEIQDEHWHVGHLYHELINRRNDEKTISYVESHDQALVGDKTFIFRLVDKEMYTHMNVFQENLLVDRGIALHNMARMLTSSTGGHGYLNFMGNEFGHPEWVDFPREGNNWSYHYARRQWHLRDDSNLRYRYMADFDREMVKIIKEHNILGIPEIYLQHEHYDDQVLAYTRGNLMFVFNFNPSKSFTDYEISAPAGKYMLILNSDDKEYGGAGRVQKAQEYHTFNENGRIFLKTYIPTRTVFVLQREELG